jgi:restriction endonuclease S subunit
MREGWVETTLGGVAKWFSGGTPKAGTAEFYDGNIPWAVIADLIEPYLVATASTISEAGLESIGGRLAPEGAVLVSMYGTIARVAIATVPMATNQAIAWGVVDEEVSSPSFVRLVVEHMQPTLDGLARGATQRNINRAILKEQKFLLPPLAEQRRIVDLIGAMDSYIADCETELEVGIGARAAMLAEQLGRVGDNWVETTLGEIADYINGFPFKPSDLGDEGLPVIRIKQLLDPTEMPDRSTVDVPQRNLLSDGDLVFSWSGTLAVRRWDRGLAVLNQHLFRVVEKDGVDRAWLQCALDHAIEELSLKTHGTTMKHITKGALLPHKVLLPPLQEQRRIAALVGVSDDHNESLRQEIALARASRAAMLAELLDGTHEIPQSYDSLSALVS